MKKVILVLLGIGVICASSAGTATAASMEGLIATLAEQAHVSESEARAQASQVFTALSAELQAGREVTVRNFGRFSVQQRQAREGRNPRTGEKLQIPAKKYPRFLSSESLKNKVNG